MKIVINACFGGFGLGSDIMSKLGYGETCTYQWDRTDWKLIELLEQHPELKGDLEIEEIPDTATDWAICEYDGAETVIYVIDGKIISTDPYSGPRKEDRIPDEFIKEEK